MYTWTVDEVGAWLSSCRLSNADVYASVLAQHAVDGEVLWDMRRKEDWNEIGPSSPPCIMRDLRLFNRHHYLW